MTKEEFCNLSIFKNIKCEPNFFGVLYQIVYETGRKEALQKIKAEMEKDLKAPTGNSL